MNKNNHHGSRMQTKVVHALRKFNRTHAVAASIWQTSTFSADSGEHFVELAG